MRPETKSKLATFGVIIFAAAIIAFFIFNKSEPNDKNPASQPNLSANIGNISEITNISTPAQYVQPLIITVLNNAFSITPVNAKNGSTPEKIDQNTVKYADAYANTDIAQTRQATKLKEEIILKAPGHPNKFQYKIDLTAYDFHKRGNGDLIFYSKGNKGNDLYKVFTIPASFMIDANGAKSYGVKTEMTNDGILTLEPDKNWLAEAIYPVVLDPTIEINILNIHSHPVRGQNWEVEFTTQGQADLKIIPNDQATIDDDEFVSLSCGDKNLKPQILSGDIILWPPAGHI